MTRPTCYNRPPAVDPRAGWIETGRYAPALPIDRRRAQLGMSPVGNNFKPVLRYRYPWFVDRCTQHDGTGCSGPGAQHASYAVAQGFDCDGCRWDPRPPSPPAGEQWTAPLDFHAARVATRMLKRLIASDPTVPFDERIAAYQWLTDDYLDACKAVVRRMQRRPIDPNASPST